MADTDSTQLKATKIAAAATIAAALIGLVAVLIPRVGDGSNNTTPNSVPTNPGPAAASVFLNTNSGPAGSTIKVSGKGFAADEEVVIRFHTNEVGSTTANGEGKFENVAVSVPSEYSKFAPQQFYVVATGQSSLRSDQAPFTVSG